MNILGGQTQDLKRASRRLFNSPGVTVLSDRHLSHHPLRGADDKPSPCTGSTSRGPKPGIKWVTLPGRRKRECRGTAALKVTTCRGRGDRCSDGLWRQQGQPREVREPSGVDEKPPGRRLRAGPGAEARGEEASSPLRSPSRSEPRRRRQLRGDPPRSTPRPAVRTPAAPCAPHPASPAGGRPRRGQPPAATHLARSGNHFFRGEESRKARRVGPGDGGEGSRDVPAAGSLGSGRHAEVRLHLGKEAAAAEPRDSASTSRGSLLTLHREEAAAEEEEAAPGRPPPRARRPPSGRSRPRRTRLLRSAKPRSGRAALGTAAQPAPRRRPQQQQQQQQRAGCNPGRGPGTPVRRRGAQGATASSGAGARCAPGDPRDRPSRQGGRRALTRSGPTLPSSPHLHASRSTLAAQLLPLPLPPLRMLARPPLPPWLGAVT